MILIMRRATDYCRDEVGFDVVMNRTPHAVILNLIQDHGNYTKTLDRSLA